MSDFISIIGKNMLPAFPQWGVHRIVDEADVEIPTSDIMSGVVAIGWETVWVDVEFRGTVGSAVGEETATLKPYFWTPANSIEIDPVTGLEIYTGGWVAQDVISDITVDSGDDGHKSALLTVNQRPFFLGVTALGAGSTVYLLVSGCKRVD